MVREARFADYSQIAGVELRNGLVPRAQGVWERIWRGNPAFTERDGGWPIGWVLEDAGGRIVGTIGNVPRRYRFQCRDIIVAAPRGWAVDLPYRSQSIFLMSAFLSQEGVEVRLTTTAGPVAERTLSGMGWLHPPVGRWDRSTMWITNYSGFLGSCIRKVAGVTRCPPKSPENDAVRSLGWYNSRIRLELCSQFDVRFDDFWRERRDRTPGKLVAARERQDLEWYYRQARLEGRLWIVAARERNELLGYGVFERRDNPANGLKRLRVMDLQALSDDARLFPAIILRVLRVCRKERIHVVENEGCWAGTARSAWSLCFRRKLQGWRYLYAARPFELRAALKEPAAWFPTGFDGEYGL